MSHSGLANTAETFCDFVITDNIFTKHTYADVDFEGLLVIP